jgi:hypothetical protein
MQSLRITGVLGTIALGGLIALGSAVDATGAEGNTPQEKQQKAVAEKAPRAKPAGRLPNYYAEVVDKAQREAIYKIQQEYEPKLAELRRQLEELTKQRDEKIRSVLTPEQLKKIEQLQEEAKKKREAAKTKPSQAQPAKPPKPEPEKPADKPPQQ